MPRTALSNLSNVERADPTTKIAAMLLQPSASEQRLRRRLDRKAEEMRALKDCLMALREDRRKERASQQQKLKASEGRAQALAKTLAACHKEIRQVHELHSAAAARQQSEIEEWKQLASRGTDDLELARTELQDAKAELTRRAEAIAEWEKVTAKSTEELEASRVELQSVRMRVDALKQELENERTMRAHDAEAAIAAQDSLKAEYDEEAAQTKTQLDRALFRSHQALLAARAEHVQKCVELEADVHATREKAASATSDAAIKVREAADIATDAAGAVHEMAEEASKRASMLADRLTVAEETALMSAQDMESHRIAAAEKILRLEELLGCRGHVLRSGEMPDDDDAGTAEVTDAELLAHLLAEDDDLQTEKRREQAVEGARIAADALADQEVRLCREHAERTRVAVREAVEHTSAKLSAVATEEWNNHHETFEREMIDARRAMEIRLQETSEKRFAEGRLKGIAEASLETAAVEKALVMKHARARRAGEEASRLARKKAQALRSRTELADRALHAQRKFFIQDLRNARNAEKSVRVRLHESDAQLIRMKATVRRAAEDLVRETSAMQALIDHSDACRVKAEKQSREASLQHSKSAAISKLSIFFWQRRCTRAQNLLNSANKTIASMVLAHAKEQKQLCEGEDGEEHENALCVPRRRALALSSPNASLTRSSTCDADFPRADDDRDYDSDNSRQGWTRCGVQFFDGLPFDQSTGQEVAWDLSPADDGQHQDDHHQSLVKKIDASTTNPAFRDKDTISMSKHHEEIEAIHRDAIDAMEAAHEKHAEALMAAASDASHQHKIRMCEELDAQRSRLSTAHKAAMSRASASHEKTLHEAEMVFVQELCAVEAKLRDAMRQIHALQDVSEKMKVEQVREIQALLSESEASKAQYNHLWEKVSEAAQREHERILVSTKSECIAAVREAQESARAYVVTEFSKRDMTEAREKASSAGRIDAEFRGRENELSKQHLCTVASMQSDFAAKFDGLLSEMDAWKEQDHESMSTRLVELQVQWNTAMASLTSAMHDERDADRRKHAMELVEVKKSVSEATEMALKRMSVALTAAHDEEVSELRKRCNELVAKECLKVRENALREQAIARKAARYRAHQLKQEHAAQIVELTGLLAQSKKEASLHARAKATAAAEVATISEILDESKRAAAESSEELKKRLKTSEQARNDMAKLLEVTSGESEALKRGHDAVVSELKNRLRASERGREDMVEREKETVRKAVDAAVSQAVACTKVAEDETLEMMRATCEITTSQEVDAAVKEATIAASAKLDKAVAAATAEGALRTQAAVDAAVAAATEEGALRTKAAVDAAVEVTLIRANATFEEEKENAVRLAIEEMALEVQVQRERDVHEIHAANEAAMAATVLEMVNDMDAEFGVKSRELQRQHKVALQKLQYEIDSRGIEMSELISVEQNERCVQAAVASANKGHETKLAMALAHASTEAESAAEEAAAIVAQAKRETAEKVEQVREATAAKAAMEHSEAMQAALAAAATEANARLASLEQDMREQRASRYDQVRVVAEDAAAKMSEAVSATETELEQSREALAASKETLSSTEAQYHKKLSIASLELGALRESLTATKSELAAAVIPHAETESLRHELFECKERFSQLREALDRHNASEDGALLREAAKVAGHHNKKQRIHFVEKLQEQHRQLQKQNGELTAEVAKLKMLQYSSIEATVHSNYNQGGRGLGLSKSGKENAVRVAAVPGAPPVLGKSKSKFKRSLLSRSKHGGRRSRVGSPR